MVMEEVENEIYFGKRKLYGRRSVEKVSERKGVSFRWMVE